MEIKKILVANRGEIAIRVIRSAKEQGIATVAVYSDADRKALHTRMADEAYHIGPPAASKSYLLGDKILEVAKQSGADAIHPGYGFLSENAAFAEAVEKAGLQFIGPSADAIRTMGDKLSAKAAVKKYNIPMVPGGDHSVTSVEDALTIAEGIGYPVLIKASAGGGGKGMRLVEDPKDLPEQMTRAVNEAKSAFGDGAVFIEKFITAPKHIEIQVMGDKHGNVVYLFERECSIQRRHQKVIEEAPSAVVDEATRKAMGQAAVNVAKACGYYNAGTVEFVVDDKLNFYFLEMNTRLQVEHPVTEMISGVDLVKEQIRVAEGKPLSISQSDLKINGHAIEVRVYAEDPANNFLPDTGTLHLYRRPQGPGIRLDDGYEEGMAIPIYYDPMIAKLCAWGKDREEAIGRMLRAIDEYKINGIATTLPFCAFTLQHPDFLGGKFTTKFVDQYFSPEKLDEMAGEGRKEVEEAAALLVAKIMQGGANNPALQAVANAEQKPFKWKKNRKLY